MTGGSTRFLFLPLPLIFILARSSCLGCEPALLEAVKDLGGLDGECTVQDFDGSLWRSSCLDSQQQQAQIHLPSLLGSLVKDSVCFVGGFALSGNMNRTAKLLFGNH